MRESPADRRRVRWQRSREAADAASDRSSPDRPSPPQQSAALLPAPERLVQLRALLVLAPQPLRGPGELGLRARDAWSLFTENFLFMGAF